MTENEAIKHLKLCKRSRLFIPNNDVLDIAIKTLEEIQQYRAIGTVEEFEAYKLGDCMNDCGHYDNCSNYIYSKGYNKAIDEFAERYKKENVAPKVFERIFRMVQLGESDFSEVAEYINSLYCDLADEVAEQMKAGAKCQK